MESSSNPCSSSSFTRGRTHDIFLSFRGEDTRNTFVDHLYAAMIQKGIHAFKDDQMLGGGKPISQSLLKAIKESKFAVVVFSKNYANSSWCLEELSEIMECHDQMELKVLPVFYHVDPSDVRRQKRDFTTAFEQYEENFREEMDKVNKWRKALNSAANISGYHISTLSGGESATINKIVLEILVGIQPHGREENLVGIESHMEKLISLLSIEATDVVHIIGIHGMGGIGKTTIARALFRRIAYKFEGSSFVNNIRENSSSHKDICVLQETVLGDILAEHSKFKIRDPEYGANMIQQRLCQKRVLLVLDDVDNEKQLEFLAAAHDWFGPGSRIIITTRDKHMLSHAKIVKYKPTLLHTDQALQLFSRHAFEKKSPPHEFKEVSHRAIRYAGHLPLALKVLGSFFHGREADVWESALHRLAKRSNSVIFDTLKLSFDGLEKYEKKIFLDIACFFKGEKVDNVTRVLDSFGFHPMVGIRVLIEKSLITISKNRLGMHDLIQEMGWQIVDEIAPNSRLWKPQEIHDFIEKSGNYELIEAINVRWLCEFFLHVDVFGKMKNLRLLNVYGIFTSLKPTILPHELRWLRWDFYPFSSLPLSNMCKLVGLEVKRSKIEHIWDEEKIMPNLKFIQLKWLERLTRFPNVSRAPNIERLILSNCKNLMEVDESLGFLKRLVYLDMSYCKKLKRLPSRIEMESLETLILKSCVSLERLPEFSISMVKLSHINCYECYAIQELPTSIRNVSNLSILNLSSCLSLDNIPDSICELKCLMTLSLQGCSSLQKLPKEFGNMKKLQKLYLGGAAESFNFHDLTNLFSLRKLDLSHSQIGDADFPKNLYGLSSLEELILRGNMELNQLPASIAHISHLKCLDLSRCKRLQSLNDLPSGIETLDASDCSSLELIKDLSEKYECLHKIHLVDCKKLLGDKQRGRYLNKMMKQSFLKKWAAADGCLSVGIPGSKIPTWFTKQLDGNKIALKLPFKWQTEIIGFAICGVFRQHASLGFSSIKFKFESGGMLDPMFGVDCINTSSAAAPHDEFENVWIGYVPLSLLKNWHHNHNKDDDDWECEDWSHIIKGNLIITLKALAVRCGAEVVYKKEVESTQQITKSSISSPYYWNCHFTLDSWSPNTIHCWD